MRLKVCKVKMWQITVTNLKHEEGFFCEDKRAHWQIQSLAWCIQNCSSAFCYLEDPKFRKLYLLDIETQLLWLWVWRMIRNLLVCHRTDIEAIECYLTVGIKNNAVNFVSSRWYLYAFEVVNDLILFTLNRNCLNYVVLSLPDTVTNCYK